MDAETVFWEIAEDLYEDRAVERSTMMGHPCLRVKGNFFAMLDRDSDRLIAKLDRARVQELIAEGVGEMFSPAGRVFKEWIAVPNPDETRWRALVEEAKLFATGG